MTVATSTPARPAGKKATPAVAKKPAHLLLPGSVVDAKLSAMRAWMARLAEDERQVYAAAVNQAVAAGSDLATADVVGQEALKRLRAEKALSGVIRCTTPALPRGQRRKKSGKQSGKNR